MGELSIRVTRTQRFFASDWPLWVWLSAFSLGLPVAMLGTINLRVALAAGWRVWLPLVVASLLFAMVGLLLGSILFSAVIVPIHYLRARFNGGPFAVGELVVVLGGKHRGRWGRVLTLGQGSAVWVEGCEGNPARFEVGQHQLLRR